MNTMIRRRSVITGIAALPLLPAQARTALGTSRTIGIGSTAPQPLGLKSYPRTLALAEGEIVLTLDDGPVPGPTGRVLDALKAEGARATFFLIGRNAAASPELVRRMVAEGHTVAHHTQTHPWTLRQMTEQGARQDIQAGFRIVEQIAHGTTGGALRVPFFRYPGFADTAPLNNWLIDQGVTIFGTDLWASDWSPMSPERQLSLLMGRLRRARRGIVLLHDVVAQTAAMLPALLAALRSGGYRLVHVEPGLMPALLHEAPAGWSPETERIIARRR